MPKRRRNVRGTGLGFRSRIPPGDEPRELEGTILHSLHALRDGTPRRT